MGRLLPCRANAAGVQLKECLDLYLDADVFGWKASPCYRCPDGQARRREVADTGDAGEDAGEAESRGFADVASDELQEFGVRLVPSAFGEALGKMVGDGHLPLIDADKVQMPDPAQDLEGFILGQYATTFIDVLDVVAAAVDRDLHESLTAARGDMVRLVDRTEAEVTRRFDREDIRGGTAERRVAQAYARRRALYVTNQVIRTIDAELGTITPGVFRDAGHPVLWARLRFAEQVLRGIAVLEDRRARDIKDRWESFIAPLWLASGHCSSKVADEVAEDGYESAEDPPDFNVTLSRVIRRVEAGLAAIVQDIPGMGLTPVGR